MTQEMSKEECNQWLNKAGISAQGSKEELKNRIIKFDSTVDSAFHPSEVDQMGTSDFWELSSKK